MFLAGNQIHGIFVRLLMAFSIMVVANISAFYWIQLCVPRHIGYPIPVAKPSDWTVAPSFIAFTFFAPQISVSIVESHQAQFGNLNLNQLIIVAIESALLFVVSVIRKYVFSSIDMSGVSRVRFFAVNGLFVILAVIVGNFCAYLFTRSVIFFEGKVNEGGGLFEGFLVAAAAIVWSPQVVVSLPWFRSTEFPSPQFNFLFVVLVEFLILLTFLELLDVLERFVLPAEQREHGINE
jgi:hypothetical protein